MDACPLRSCYCHHAGEGGMHHKYGRTIRTFSSSSNAMPRSCYLPTFDLLQSFICNIMLRKRSPPSVRTRCPETGSKRCLRKQCRAQPQVSDDCTALRLQPPHLGLAATCAPRAPHFDHLIRFNQYSHSGPCVSEYFYYTLFFW